MFRYRYFSVVLIIVAIGAAVFNYISETNQNSTLHRFAFKYGLDLKGGTELVYNADISDVASKDVGDSMNSLRDVIERRVNLFGVSEPIVQTENAGVISGSVEYRLVVDLPGVTDIEKAVELIGKTPTLEFRLAKGNAKELLEKADLNQASTTIDGLFEPAVVTGRLLSRASLEFDPNSSEPFVALSFNDEGKELFAKVTREHTGEILAIFLDGVPISMPVIREEIKDGKAQITGNFNPEEARTLVRDLNYGALPVPITLVSTQTIGPTLGGVALDAGVSAGIWGFLMVVIFLVIWYRLPGVVASVSLVLYVLFSLAVFKLIPVTLTAAGLAGFILSIGMAVDANILIFERMKEERSKGRDLQSAIHEGFRRAWLSIRDSNISSIITAIVLFWIGTAAVKGFALTLGIGVVVSMFTAITASRTFLFALGVKGESRISRFLFGSGVSLKAKKLTS